MPNPKPGTFTYEVKWLITRYALETVGDEGFKEQIDDLFHRFPMTPESAAASICKYLHDKEKYGRLTVDDVKHIADLVFEVNPAVGGIIYEWMDEIYG